MVWFDWAQTVRKTWVAYVTHIAYNRSFFCSDHHDELEDAVANLHPPLAKKAGWDVGTSQPGRADGTSRPREG